MNTAEKLLKAAENISAEANEVCVQSSLIRKLNHALDGRAVNEDMTRNYELIETITLTEETTLIERTEEPDGTPYNFKDVFIVFSGGDTGVSGKWILWKVWFGNEAIETFRNLTMGGANKTILSSKTDGNLRQLLFGTSSTNEGHATSALYENLKYLFTNENISKMTFQHQTAMPAGTKIDIYAIRG